jgi:nicotinate phosphoribosyltransferase
MITFAETRDVRVPRIALVDFSNDCIGVSLRVMKAMFARYQACIEQGDTEQAARFRLYAVRPDTSASLRDIGIPPLGDPELDCGVNPRLVFALRRAIDEAYLGWDLEPEWSARAREWCHQVKIVVTGGFSPAKIERFERLQVPADIYGVGSSLLESCARCGTNTDFTADVVRVQLADRWVDMAKVGRRSCDNADMEPIQWDSI